MVAIEGAEADSVAALPEAVPPVDFVVALPAVVAPADFVVVLPVAVVPADFAAEVTGVAAAGLTPAVS
jgi:hypothetical protein